jgi:hypothetical protein
MKAIVGGAIGAAALGGALLLANTRSAAPAGPAATVASTNLAQLGPLSVDCGVGRMALLKPVAPGQAYSQVECVSSAAVIEPQAFAQPQGGYLVQASYPAQPAVQERVVYRDRVVERPVARSTARRSVTYAPARTEVKQGRSWKKSALIIGGSAAGGAGVGALLGGGSGAKKGAIVGGVGGLVYDLATRNK